jgi:glycosyltransferase involved in cell wall biosynthesis
LYSFRLGGSERVGAQLALEYAARGYEVVCFAFHGANGPFRDQLESSGIECVDLNYLTRTPIVRRVTYQLELYRFFRRRRVRALHVHHALALTLGGIAARCAGIRNVVMTEHAIFQLEEQPRYRRSSARDCHYATAITGVHAGITDYFRDRLQVDPERLHVIPNGVPEFKGDAQVRRQMRAALGVDKAVFVCLYIGRLEAVKDLRTLLKAIRAMAESNHRNVRLFIAGEGAEGTELQAVSRSMALDSIVRFLGPRSDVSDLLNMADAFVMSSLTEGLPMALLEAMAAGLPCVATAVGGIPEVLSANAGILVPPNDPGAIAQALTRLASDEPLRKDIAKHAAAKVRTNYGLEPIVTKYLGLLGLPAHWPAGR